MLPFRVKGGSNLNSGIALHMAREFGPAEGVNGTGLWALSEGAQSGGRGDAPSSETKLDASVSFHHQQIVMQSSRNGEPQARRRPSP